MRAQVAIGKGPRISGVQPREGRIDDLGRQRAEIGQSPDAMGAMIRISPVYGYHPFGKEDGRYSLEHRFAFQLSAQAYFTIKEALAIEAGLSIPFFALSKHIVL